jgi:hypothetical protein
VDGRVDVVVGTQFEREVALLGSPGDSHCLKARGGGELYTEVAEAAEALYRSDVSGVRIALPERVERADASTEQRRGVGGVEAVRNPGERVGWCRHVLGVPAVGVDAGHLLAVTVDEVPPATRLAGETVVAVPADADPLAGLPGVDVCADRVDVTRDLVAGHSRIVDVRPVPLLRVGVAVTDATGVHLHAHFVWTRVRNRHLDDFELAARSTHSDGLHAITTHGGCGVLGASV